MKSYTLEEAKKLFANSGLTLLAETYKSVDKNMECIDKDGYKYYRSLRTILDKRNKSVEIKHIFSIKNKFAWDNINHYMNQAIFNGTKLLSQKTDYQDSDSKLLFLCGECGKTYWKRFLDFKHDQYKICPNCYKLHEKQNPHRQRNDMSIYQEKAKKLGMTLINEQSVTYNGKLEVEDDDGFKGFVGVAQMMRLDSKFEKYSTKNPYTLYNMRHYAELNNMDCQIPDQKFVGDKAMMKFVCFCGEPFETSLTHFLHDKKYRCNKCRVKQSNIATLVQQYLDSNNIKYVKEKVFTNCVGDSGKHLPFDFYVASLNLCIEVDGIQHYKPIDFGGNKENVEKRFAKCQKYDELKNKFCASNNISLLRIPFWKIENSKEYISELNKIFFPSKSSEL